MKTWIKALVSFGVLGLLATLIPWSELSTAAKSASLSVWSVVLLGFLVGHFLGVVKWRLLVNAAGANLPMFAAVRCYAAGLFANLCLPSIVGGDVLRAALAGRATERAEVAILIGVADRLIDLASLALFMVIAGAMVGDLAEAWPSRVLVTSIVVGGIAGAIALPFLLNMRLSRWPRKVRRRVGRTLVSLRALRRSPGAAVTAVVLSVTIQGSFVLLNAWLGHSIGIDIPLAAWFLVWPLAKLSGLLPVSLGGLGVRDATLAALLVPLGIAAAQGFVVSLLWQSVMIVGGLLCGALWWSTRATGERLDTRTASTAESVSSETPA